MSRVCLLPGGLVLQDIPERNASDYLTGKPLDTVRVTFAKHVELTGMYRRQVWVERPVEDCYRDTGRPPIPVRWVVTNKGDELHPNVRCRLVAKHLAAKYGGEEAEAFFAAMPPLVKADKVLADQSSSEEQLEDDAEKSHVY